MSKQYFLDRIEQKRLLRNWDALPSDFMTDAVAVLYKELKPHFDKRDIRARIEASRARTFTDLRYAVNLMLWL